MSTALNNNVRPLWVWIVVITLGSLFILGMIALLLRYCIRRRRKPSEAELISEEPAEKKLTLRRGRTVPAASYLSLTGSRFGLNSFDPEGSVVSPSVRSKSPFDWWASIKRRSSRLSYVSYGSSAGPYLASPQRGSFYQKPNFSISKSSLASRDEHVRATVTEVKIGEPAPAIVVGPSFKRSSRSFEPVNFSRSFTSQTQRSLQAYRNQTLSRIEEATPRESVFSTISYHAYDGTGNSSDNFHQPEMPLPKRKSAASLLKVPIVNYIRNNSRNASAESILPAESEKEVSVHSSPPSPATPTFPDPTADPNTSRRSLWESDMKQFPSLQAHRNSFSTDFVLAFDNVNANTEALPPPPTLPQQQPQIEQERQRSRSTTIGTRTEDHAQTSSLPQNQSQSQGQSQPPSRNGSTNRGRSRSRSRGRKGNVLRKKSLQRAETAVNHSQI